MKQQKHIPEEVIIDAVLGNLSKEKLEEVLAHTKECNTCKTVLHNWQQTFQTTPSVQPSQTLKQKVRDQIDKKVCVRKKLRRPAFIFSIAGFACLLFLTFGLFQVNNTNNNSIEVVQHEDIPGEKIQFSPETKQIAVLPVTNHFNIEGNVWVNDYTNEMLLEVDGLERSSGQDYQLWIIYDNDKMEGEVLLVKDGFSRVFFRGNDVPNLKMIKASVEPKGGSIEPTGPETFVVPLNYNGL